VGGEGHEIAHFAGLYGSIPHECESLPTPKTIQGGPIGASSSAAALAGRMCETGRRLQVSGSVHQVCVPYGEMNQPFGDFRQPFADTTTWNWCTIRDLVENEEKSGHTRHYRQTTIPASRRVPSCDGGCGGSVCTEVATLTEVLGPPEEESQISRPLCHPGTNPTRGGNKYVLGITGVRTYPDLERSRNRRDERS